jgi:hypothetical protein
MPACRTLVRAIAHQTDVDVASEFRYRTPPLAQGGLGILVSQSGETAATMAALRYMREQQHVPPCECPGERHGARIGCGAGDGGGSEVSVATSVHRAARCWHAWRSLRARAARLTSEEAA